MCPVSYTPSPANPNWSEENKYYYPPEPKHIAGYKETIPILVTGESKSEQQKKKEEEERIEHRRIVEGIDDDDLDYYSDLDTIYQDYV